jgi:hypothetical protein
MERFKFLSHIGQNVMTEALEAAEFSNETKEIVGADPDYTGIVSKLTAKSVARFIKRRCSKSTSPQYGDLEPTVLGHADLAEDEFGGEYSHRWGVEIDGVLFEVKKLSSSPSVANWYVKPIEKRDTFLAKLDAQ